MKRIFIGLLAGLLCQPALTAEPAATSGALTQNQLLSALARQVLLPQVREFGQASDWLAASSAAFCAGKAELAAVQAAWRDVQADWQPLEMLQLGPVIDRRVQRQVNAWPFRLRLLQPLLDSHHPVTPDQTQALGSAGKGLPALEYLLFEAPQTLSAGARCSLLQALALQVQGEAQGLLADWRGPDGGYARQLAEAGRHRQDGVFASADQAVSDLVNLMIAGLEAVTTRKLGKALQKSDDEPALERIESWRSGTSLDHIRANLRGFELAFFGAGSKGTGLDDYLASIGRPGLVRVVRNQLDSIREALAAVRPPLRMAVVSQRQQVEKLHTEIRRLQYLFETEVATALQVDLGFNTSDGD